MNMERRILSIDFDYFQDVSRDTLLECYPDGYDLPTQLSILTWSGYYNNPKTAEKLKKVEILKDELNSMKEILQSDQILDDADIMITNSHVWIYDFIHEYIKPTQEIYCVNVDLHHDFKNGSSSVDCGNWVYHLKKEFKKDFVFRWIPNPISREVYGLIEKDFDCLFIESLENIKNMKFDAVFLCRSDNWFAPHLDSYFDEIIELMKRKFHNIRIQSNVCKIRDYRKYDYLYENLYTRKQSNEIYLRERSNA